MKQSIIKIFLIIAAVFTINTTALAAPHFSSLECTIKDVRSMDRYGMFNDGEWFDKNKVGKIFHVDRMSGNILGEPLNNSHSLEKIVKDQVSSHQSYVVISHDDELTSGVNTLHVWLSAIEEIEKNGYPFIYTPDTLRTFYSGTCRIK